jgi:hypothetical protein
MSLIDDAKAWLSRLPKTGGTVADQLLKVSLESGGGPLSGIDWDAHRETVVSNVVTYEFFKGGLAGTKLATGVLTYTNASLNTLISSVWTYP